ncbi:DUF3025 domain-containing protein [Acidovorax facilis]|uniref:DUF3025 domain-containing protein n=1 Tax=Acidovorax facilis TaxID=12917 RepID=UPI003CF758D9
MAAGVSEAFDAIDWSAPWLAPWRNLGQPVAQQLQHDPAVHRALQAAAPPALPVGFVPQSELPEGTAYEQYIWDTRRVPTRDNLHDFFNGLVWQQFPHTKRRLNELQARTIAADGVQAVRGPLRDALTVFDENGAVLQAPPALWAALRVRDWQRLFIDLRPLWGQARLVVFGHALLEKLVIPRKPMVAHVYQAPAAIESIAILDAWLAGEIHSQQWATKPFTPLPVLGVPGWWPPNETPDFYADTQVFRLPRAVPGG